MDIARDPTVPADNLQTADAAPMPRHPPEIRRKDYHPPAWLVDEVALDFALDPDATQVASRLRVRRNPAGDGANEIRLNGDGIAALAVTVDGQPTNDWRMDGPDLIVALPGDAHEIGVETLSEVGLKDVACADQFDNACDRALIGRAGEIRGDVAFVPCGVCHVLRCDLFDALSQ